MECTGSANEFPALAAEPRASVWMLGALLYQPVWDELMRLEILDWAVKSGNDESRRVEDGFFHRAQRSATQLGEGSCFN
jgi:hypothetical protein